MATEMNAKTILGAGAAGLICLVGVGIILLLFLLLMIASSISLAWQRFAGRTSRKPGR